jgi:S1-C subfamily serine protease
MTCDPARPEKELARRFRRLRRDIPRIVSGLVAGLIGWAGASGTAVAGLDEVVDSVLGIRAEISSDARTATSLGTRRSGTGILLDDHGLVLTIGYLVLEASTVQLVTAEGREIPADIVAYDYDTGFGLVRALLPLQSEPVPRGEAAQLEVGQQLFVLSRAEGLSGTPVQLADRREFAGYWEYLLDSALFTLPAHSNFAGAALMDAEGRLLGIGSLFVGDATGAGIPAPGNMFVPIDLLEPVLADLLDDGERAGPARPWLGLNVVEARGRVRITRVQTGSPADRAGLLPEDAIEGVAGTAVSSLAELYRAIWRQGEAGIEIALDIRRGVSPMRVDVHSIDRRSWVRRPPSL